MFSTNLIQSNYGDLNIKSLAFDSFKEKAAVYYDSTHFLYINGSM